MIGFGWTLARTAPLHWVYLMVVLRWSPWRASWAVVSEHWGLLVWYWRTSR